MRNFKEIKERVRQYMITFPSCRDNCDELICRMWWDDLKLLGKKDVSVKEFMVLFRDGKLSSFNSVNRSWRKWQQEVPALRGSKYFARQKKAEETKEQLKAKGNWRNRKNEPFA